MALPFFSDNMTYHERTSIPPYMTRIVMAHPARRLLPMLLLGVAGQVNGALAQDTAAASAVPPNPSLFAPPVAPVVASGPLTFAPLVRQVGPAVVNIAVS